MDGSRVLHLTEHWRGGGTEAMVSSLLPGLRGAGFTVSLATLDPAPREDLLPAGIPLQRVTGRCALDPRAAARLARLLRRGRFALLHTHQVRADLAGAAARIAGGARMISTRHETLPFRIRRGIRGTAFRALDRRAVAGAAATVCISGAVRDFLVREEGIPASRLTVIRNGVDVSRFVPLGRDDVAAARAAAGIDPAGPVLGFLGRLEDAKGADLLPALWGMIAGRCPTATLVIAGEGDVAPRLDGLAGKILRTGRADPARILPILDLLLVPSRSEGLSLAAIEAAACGVPAVAFATGGLPEAVADGDTGILVPAGDVAGLAAAAAALADDPGRRAALGARARDRAVREFSLQRMVADYVRLYRACLQGKAWA